MQVTLIFRLEQYVGGSGVLNLVSLHPPPFGFKVFCRIWLGFSYPNDLAGTGLYGSLLWQALPVALLHAGIGVFIFNCHCLPVLAVDRFRSSLI